MRNPITILITVSAALFLVFFPTDIFAQNIAQLHEFNQTRLVFNQRGMLILGAWAIGNMIWGGIGASRSLGVKKGFHQMNLYWNTVNLAIAAFGYYQAINDSPDIDFLATIVAQHGIEKILLFNAALDIAYMTGGLFMLERGRRKDDERLLGFGKSVILQGAFLMVFDAILYGFHVSNAKELPELMKNLNLVLTGIFLP
ncbi:MAG: hypothetical protein ABJI77_14730 [Algoriphagus sp.]|uniref:DUF6992 family protein n=1 Tax=Algoriphagus sp. TaxID=1872435 RepID=UPI003297BA64